MSKLVTDKGRFSLGFVVSASSTSAIISASLLALPSIFFATRWAYARSGARLMSCAPLLMTAKGVRMSCDKAAASLLRSSSLTTVYSRTAARTAELIERSIMPQSPLLIATPCLALTV